MNEEIFVSTASGPDGPFSPAVLLKKIQSNELPGAALVWWKGEQAWVPATEWVRHTQRQGELHSEVVWHLDVGNQDRLDALTLTQVLEKLKSVRDISLVKIWTAGMDSWVSPYEIPEIMSEFNLERRSDLRVPLTAEARVRCVADGSDFVVGATSISMSGLRLAPHPGLKLSDEISIFLKSADFDHELYLRGVVMHSGPEAIGIRLQDTHPGTQQILAHYIAKFAVV